MNKILIITSLLPIKEISGKRNENDILLIIEEEIKKRYPVNFIYLFPLHFWIHDYIRLFFTNKKKFDKKIKEYRTLKNKQYIIVKDRKVYLIPMIAFPFLFKLRNGFRNLYYKKYHKRVKQIIETENPNVIHAQSTEIDSFLAKKIKKEYHIPYITTLRGLKYGADCISKKNIKEASDLIAISPTQIKHAKKLTNKNIILIPHGINNVFFNAKETKKTGSNKTTLQLLYYGRLRKSKNIDIVILALAEFSNFSLDIIGDGEEEKALQQLVAQKKIEDRVHFHGRLSQNQIASIINNYDIFIMPSENESLGRVYFEAMAGGLPVIASKGTGIDGLIKNKKEGILVTPGSLNELIEVFKTINSNPEILNTMRSNATSFAEKYTWSQVAQNYYELYIKYQS